MTRPTSWSSAAGRSACARQRRSSAAARACWCSRAGGSASRPGPATQPDARRALGPMPTPGTVPQALRWMLDPGQPAASAPDAPPRVLRWAYDSGAARRRRARARGWRRSSPSAAGRSRPTRRCATPASSRVPRRRPAVRRPHREELAAELTALRDQRALGFAGRVEALDAAATLALEPALAPGVAGGILAADERHVRPETVPPGSRPSCARTERRCARAPRSTASPATAPGGR